MDKLDMQILSHLLNNCRKPDRQIGQEIGISGVAVKSRIQKMIENKIIEEFALKIEPPVLGYSVLYFVVTGKEIDDIIQKIRLVGEPFFVVPCVGGITVCSIVVKEDPAKRMDLAKNLLRDVRVLSVFEAKNPEIRSDLTKTDIEIIDILLKDPRLKIEEIAKESGFSTTTIARSLEKLAKVFAGSYLQNPFVHMNQIVLFMYTDNIYKMDDLSGKVHDIEGIHSVDLFMPKKITFLNKWVRDAIIQAKKSKRLHLMSEIHS